MLPGGDYSKATSLNQLGQAVGVAATASGDRAFLWTGSTLQDLGTLPGDTSSEAFDINDLGAVVGSSTGPDGVHGFLWTKNRGMENLGTLPGGQFTKVVEINNSGVVVGYSSSSLGTRAFVWTSSAGIQDLNNLIPADSNIVLLEALGINDKGQILAVGKQLDATSSHGHDVKHDNHQGPINLFQLNPKRPTN
jgi:probable HAF family extracellular repeat protein